MWWSSLIPFIYWCYLFLYRLETTLEFFCVHGLFFLGVRNLFQLRDGLWRPRFRRGTLRQSSRLEHFLHAAVSSWHITELPQILSSNLHDRRLWALCRHFAFAFFGNDWVGNVNWFFAASPRVLLVPGAPKHLDTLPVPSSSTSQIKKKNTWFRGKLGPCTFRKLL